MSLTPVKHHRTTTFSPQLADKSFYTPPQKKNLDKTAFSAWPSEDLFSYDNNKVVKRSNNLFGTKSSSSRNPLNLGGIKNLGNTCFIGGVLQAMFCLESFRKDLSSSFWTSVIKDASCLVGEDDKNKLSCVAEFSRIMRNAHVKQKSPLNVLKLKDAITLSLGKYQGFAQHDAHEFLGDLLNLVEENLDRGLNVLLSKHDLMFAVETSCEVKGTETVSSPLRQGVVVAEVLSTQSASSPVLRTPAPVTATSGTVTAKDKNAVGNRPPVLHAGEGEGGASAFVCASSTSRPSVQKLLNPATHCFSSTVNATLTCTSCQQQRVVQEQYKDFALEIDASDSAHESIPLQNLFSLFFAKETRDLQCEHCNNSSAKVDVTTSILELPDVLCVQLKRFRYDNTLQEYEKISKKVSFPSLLNMRPFCSPDVILDGVQEAKANHQSRQSVLDKAYTEMLTGPLVEVRKSTSPGQTTPGIVSKLSSPESSPAHSPELVLEGKEEEEVEGEWEDWAPSPPGSVWTCDACTFVNNKLSQPLASDFEELEVCEMCNIHRFSADEETGSVVEDAVASIDESTLPFTYELVAVLRHVGCHASAGHYTCDVKKAQEHKTGERSNKWQHCDDSVLTSITQVNTPHSMYHSMYICM
jgi:ubiquitin C-terminal hydrolase